MKRVILALLMIAISFCFAFGVLPTWQVQSTTPINTLNAALGFNSDGSPVWAYSTSAAGDPLKVLFINYSTYAITTNTNALSDGAVREVKIFNYNDDTYIGFWDITNNYFLNIQRYTNAGQWFGLGVTNSPTPNKASQWSFGQDTNTNSYIVYSDPAAYPSAYRYTNAGTWISDRTGLPFGVPIQFTDMNGSLHFNTGYLIFKQLRVSTYPQFYTKTNHQVGWTSVGGLKYNPLSLNLCMAPYPTVSYIDYTNFSYIPTVRKYTPAATNIYIAYFQAYPVWNTKITNFTDVGPVEITNRFTFGTNWVTNIFSAYPTNSPTFTSKYTNIVFVGASKLTNVVHTGSYFSTNIMNNTPSLTNTFQITNVNIDSIYGSLTNYNITNTIVVFANWITNYFGTNTNACTNDATTNCTNTYNYVWTTNYTVITNMTNTFVVTNTVVDARKGLVTNDGLTNFMYVFSNVITNVFNGTAFGGANVAYAQLTNAITYSWTTNYPDTNNTTNLVWAWSKAGYFPISTKTQFKEMSMAATSTNDLYVALLDASSKLSVWKLTNKAATWIRLTNSGLPGVAIRNIQMKMSPLDIPSISYQAGALTGSNSYSLIMLH
jgi:hypothetical protein